MSRNVVNKRTVGAKDADSGGASLMLSELSPSTRVPPHRTEMVDPDSLRTGDFRPDRPELSHSSACT